MAAVVDILELPDWEFQGEWLALSAEEKHAIGPRGFDRYRTLTDYMDDSIARLERGQALSIPKPPVANSHVIDWASKTDDPAPFPWIMEHWLSWHPTLLAGRGGIGKSLLIQAVGTALATGSPTWCPARDPLRVLYWACEDDEDELHRRQHVICKQMRIGFDALDNLYTDARYGLESTLMASDFGRPVWTPQIELLRQQVNDWQIDVLCLDNIGHTFGANENARYDVTRFLNGIAGLVVGRPFCPIVLGHPSKAMGSEYSGSTAWENAVRMRWYLDDKMPDQKGEADTPDRDYRVLSKRKANYGVLDCIQFKFDSGVLVPEQAAQGDPGIIKALRAKRGRQVVLDAIRALGERGMHGNGRIGRYYLPSLMHKHGLSEGYSTSELDDAIQGMIFDQELQEMDVGRNAAGRPVIGLKPKIIK